jgi:ABC-type multidrug transport system fused ATPase/permease subunit
LDEASSSIGPGEGDIVARALARASDGRTAIVIATSVATIRSCELLFVMNDGRIVEHGSFDALTSDADSYFNQLLAGIVA